MDEEVFYTTIDPSYDKGHVNTCGRPLIGFIRKVCDEREEIILEHTIRNKFGTEHTSQNTILIIKVIRKHNLFGMSCYSICLTLFGMYEKGIHTDYGTWTDYMYNIPYMPKSVLDMITKMHFTNEDCCKYITQPNGCKECIYPNRPIQLSKIKQQILDKLNEDPMYQELSQINIVDELKHLKIENEKHHKNKQKYKTKLSDMKLTIQQMQEDMKTLFAKTAELQEENKLLKQEKECLSFTQANKIGQSLIDKEDIFNCM
jgi:hypothetical protein